LAVGKRKGALNFNEKGGGHQGRRKMETLGARGFSPCSEEDSSLERYQAGNYLSVAEIKKDENMRRSKTFTESMKKKRSLPRVPQK